MPTPGTGVASQCRMSATAATAIAPLSHKFRANKR